MPLIKQGQLARDPWTDLADEAPVEPGTLPIVSLERWQADREALDGRNGPIGLRLRSDQSPEAIADEIHRFDVIALEFPKFNDGRAYSSARILRERYGFTGEIRAVGQVLRDQFLFMLRCGIDAFEVADEKAAAAWTESLNEIDVFYQATGDGRPTVWALRKKRQAAESKAKAKAVKCRSGGAYEAAPATLGAAPEGV